MGKVKKFINKEFGLSTTQTNTQIEEVKLDRKSVQIKETNIYDLQ